MMGFVYDKPQCVGWLEDFEQQPRVVVSPNFKVQKWQFAIFLYLVGEIDGLMDWSKLDRSPSFKKNYYAKCLLHRKTKSVEPPEKFSEQIYLLTVSKNQLSQQI
jgi:hypothetical protein